MENNGVKLKEGISLLIICIKIASVVQWSQFLATDLEVPVRFQALPEKKKKWIWNGIHSASWVQFKSYLKEKVVVPV
jgi:hypothetical protein